MTFYSNVIIFYLDKFRRIRQNCRAVKVPIRADQLKGLPFSLKSRNGIAIVFSFFGDNELVADLMQKTSHATREYYFHSLGFHSFVKPSIVDVL